MKKKMIALGLMMCMVLAGCSSTPKESSNTKALDVQMKAAVEKIGEENAATMELTKDDMIAKFGLNSEDVEDAKANIAMMSTQIDTILVVRAKDGKAADVKKAMDTYRQTMVDDTLQYPMNIPLIQGSIVKENGNDIYFIMLGVYSDEFMDLDEEGQIKEANKHNEEVYQAMI